ncbi:MAG: TetR/AcrR family transcriptional regulator [Planctomycetia bacterium]|nr:TetR/AcrR family transcriptional regulator [Planctomycetia bacterium]
MRITAAEKQATRGRIVDSARELFRTRGFDATTTRDIARAAGIAAGTLFNYFDSKEAVVVTLAAEGLARARAEFTDRDAGGSLEEDLFALISAELRQIKPLRKFIAPVLETALSPLACADRAGNHEALRVDHLELVAEIARRHDLAEIPPMALEAYWALYTGVLAFWASDKSSKQEDTLALLDQSINMFAGWLNSAAGTPR